MQKLFIGIVVPPFAEEVFKMVEARAQEELRTYPGCSELTLSHGNGPFHLTLVAPFTPPTMARQQNVELGLARVSKERTSFTLTTGALLSFGNHTVALATRDRSTLEALRTAVHTSINRQLPRELFPHVSIARNFPSDHFQQVREACARAYCHYARHFPLSFRVEGFTLFGREEDGWKPYTTYDFGDRSTLRRI